MILWLVMEIVHETHEKHEKIVMELTLRSNVFSLPFAAPSTAGFVGNSPKGRGKDAARQQEGRKAL
ncbi:MAG: hypothetical protein WAW36_09540, partial [Methylovulum miyakonense]